MLDQDRFRISDRNACGVVGALNDKAIVIIKLYQVLTGKETLAEAKAWFEADSIKATMELIAIQSSEEITEKIVSALESKHRKNAADPPSLRNILTGITMPVSGDPSSRIDKKSKNKRYRIFLPKCSVDFWLYFVLIALCVITDNGRCSLFGQ